jgi:hypothetical protein
MEKVQPFLRVAGLDDVIRRFQHRLQRGPYPGFVID